MYVRLIGVDHGQRRHVPATGAIASDEQQAAAAPSQMDVRVLNPVVKALLGSPLHGLLSHDLMVLSFSGRKSGKQYAIPVGYLQKVGGRLMVGIATPAINELLEVL